MAKASNRAHLMLALAVLCGCQERTHPVPDAGGLEAARADAGLSALPPPELQLTVRYEASDGGMLELPFQAGNRPFVDPTQKLEISSNLPLHNYRIRLFDEADRALISDDDAAGMVYRIQLASPLKTGHRYALVVDSQTGSTFSDAAGRSQADQRLEFQITGEREKTPPAKRSKAKKHHR